MIDGYQLALTCRISQLEPLRATLLEYTKTVPVVAIALRANIAQDSAMALIELKNAAMAVVGRPHLVRAIGENKFEIIDLFKLEGPARQELKKKVEGLTAQTRGSVDVAFEAMKGLMAGPPALRIDFGDKEDFFVAWSRHVAEGGLFLPSRRPPSGPEVKLSIVVGKDVFEGQQAMVLQRPPPHANASGFWAKIVAQPQLLEMLERYTFERKQGRRQPTTNPERRDARYETFLEVQFSQVNDLEREFAINISQGGLFVATDKAPPIRTRGELQIKLPNGAIVKILAEVVHVITANDAKLRNTKAGAGLAFVSKDPAQFTAIESLLAEYKKRASNILLIDSNQEFAKELGERLRKLGTTVTIAHTGSDALTQLIEKFFDLDMVIVDMMMPNFEGQALVERIQKEGGDSKLKLVCTVDMTDTVERTVLAEALGVPVFAKDLDLEELSQRLASSLGVTP